MKKINNLISVIVPVYDAEKYLCECIDSILSQTFTNFECILVDDCSVDKSPMICDKYEEKDIRVQVIHKAKNEGSSLARKTGLEKSSGDYILFVDADDWIEIDMLKKLYETAISEDYDITICDCFYSKDGMSKMIEQSFADFNKVSMIKDLLSIRAKAYLVNKLVKRKIYAQVVFPLCSNSEDYVITIQNVHNACKIGYINVPLYHYRYNAQSLSNNKERENTALLEENKNWHIIVSFLREKYKTLHIFEPELSIRINSMKSKYSRNRILKKNKELFKLYPESNFLYWRIVKFIKKMIKKILPPIMYVGKIKNKVR